MRIQRVRAGSRQLSRAGSVRSEDAITEGITDVRTRVLTDVLTRTDKRPGRHGTLPQLNTLVVHAAPRRLR